MWYWHIPSPFNPSRTTRALVEGADQAPSTRRRAERILGERVKPTGPTAEKELVPTASTGRTDSSVGISSQQARASRSAHPTVRHAVETMLLEERTRWAMQIHDNLTQSVTSAVLEIQTLRHRISTDPEGAIAALKIVENEIREDLSRIRETLFEMTRETPPKAEPALSAVVRDQIDRWGLPAQVSIEGDIEDLPEEVLETAHAIIAESLANAAKHSGAPEALVRVHAGEGELLVEVEDRGKGIAAVTDDDPHFGLRIMRARAEALGGSLDIESTPGHGTKVRAVLPVGGRGEG